MADLPKEWLDDSTALTIVRLRTLAPCLSMRLVHVELALKLGKEGLLNAIMRFIARRVKSGAIIGHDGTNFVGAERKIAGYDVAWNKERIEKHLVQHGI